jgi:hypothetical protein
MLNKVKRINREQCASYRPQYLTSVDDRIKLTLPAGIA